ncbi:SDR family oxidoreductase [Nocardiopsis sp. NPDC006938]|uniref:SDR family oxidoreductase n=1 Tax=Nocardiopsis sp. NPDC006938 TaxID=3364337 RepID=UPI0036C622B0
MNAADEGARHGRGVAVVTGGGSGLGRAAALALLADGWSVAVAGRRKEALEETVALAGADADRMAAVPTDISRTEEVTALFTAVLERFGRVDLLFNNAGAVVPRVPVRDVTVDDWNRIMDTTVTGTFLCAREAFRVMCEQSPRGGRIINNGAPSAHAPRPNAVAYTTAKHAVLGLTKALSLDGRDLGIACGQIDVGNVEPSDGLPQPPARQADGSTAVERTIPVERFTEALLLMASMPPGSNVQYLTVLPTTMPFVGRG